MNDGFLTAADVMNEAGITFPGVEWITDRLLSLTCPNCGTLQTLSQATLQSNPDLGMISLYACKNCSSAVLATGHWGFRATEDVRFAYRLGEYAIYPGADLSVRVGSDLVRIPIG